MPKDTPSPSLADELEPCAHCGSRATFGVVTEGGENNPDFGGHFVQCTNEKCHACMGLRFACGDDPRPALRDAWNTGPTEARTGGDALLRRIKERIERADRDGGVLAMTGAISEVAAWIEAALSHPTPADDARTPDDVVEALGEVKTNIAWAEEHYSGPEFFDVAWPEIRKSLDALNTALTASGDARERALRERMVGMMRSLADDHAVSIRDYSEEARTILALLDTPPAGDGGGV